MKHFLQYWTENFTQAKDGFDKFMLGSGIVASLLTTICTVFEFPNSVGNFIDDANVKILTTIAAVLFFGAWALIWLPFKRHLSCMAEVEGPERERIRKHDAKIYEALNELCTERKLTSICNTIMFNRVVDSDEIDVLHRLLRFCDEVGNELMTPSLKKPYCRFRDALDQFSSLVAKVFFVLPDSGPPPREVWEINRCRYALYPELKEFPQDHENRIRYEQAYADTETAGTAVLGAYEAFRREVKDVLFV